MPESSASTAEAAPVTAAVTIVPESRAIGALSSSRTVPAAAVPTRRFVPPVPAATRPVPALAGEAAAIASRVALTVPTRDTPALVSAAGAGATGSPA